jgi:hypothetical protein
MKNKVFMASLGLVLLFALSFAACKNEPDAATIFEGDWTISFSGNTYTLQIRGTSMTRLTNGNQVGVGTFDYTDTTFTFYDNVYGTYNYTYVFPTSSSLKLTYVSGGTPDPWMGGGTWTRQ